MLKCPKCFATLDENPDFCTNCGKQLYSLCRGCGKKLQGSPQFCPYCNSMLR